MRLGLGQFDQVAIYLGYAILLLLDGLILVALFFFIRRTLRGRHLTLAKANPRPEVKRPQISNLISTIVVMIIVGGGLERIVHLDGNLWMINFGVLLGAFWLALAWVLIQDVLYFLSRK